ncbi:MAG TPA: hypothetical protein PKL56_04735 [Cyclobacteriaceae bacterium]|nr:hypothetical protein [Cyclobacteriaceae bacterium]HMV11219.1 hypothetical protein [Cyclobacteriaceae bacterium]HMV90671.1 hypothetical protein [Cyclobacteriaceae bacterium]HMX02558.1 hypothetical protein [Cyclobacteriaceae bacterium]HMX50943.1 hypothetical protein [Cyclobacteriaceae bacterium]
MQKRLTRLSTPAQIQSELARFTGKKINIVLTDNTVLLAELLKFSGINLDLRNMRGQKLTVAIDDIYEIIIDIND